MVRNIWFLSPLVPSKLSYLVIENHYVDWSIFLRISLHVVYNHDPSTNADYSTSGQKYEKKPNRPPLPFEDGQILVFHCADKDA